MSARETEALIDAGWTPSGYWLQNNPGVRISADCHELIDVEGRIWRATPTDNHRGDYYWAVNGVRTLNWNAIRGVRWNPTATWVMQNVRSLLQ